MGTSNTDAAVTDLLLNRLATNYDVSATDCREAVREAGFSVSGSLADFEWYCEGLGFEWDTSGRGKRLSV